MSIDPADLPFFSSMARCRTTSCPLMGSCLRALLVRRDEIKGGPFHASNMVGDEREGCSEYVPWIGGEDADQ